VEADSTVYPALGRAEGPALPSPSGEKNFGQRVFESPQGFSYPSSRRLFLIPDPLEETVEGRSCSLCEPQPKGGKESAIFRGVAGAGCAGVRVTLALKVGWSRDGKRKGRAGITSLSEGLGQCGETQDGREVVQLWRQCQEMALLGDSKGCEGEVRLGGGLLLHTWGAENP
jgi:hypothetical protein